MRTNYMMTVDDVMEELGVKRSKALDIVPLTLAQYREYFMAMFRTGHANPEKLRELILLCETRRDILNAPGWKAYIGNAVDEKIKRMEEKTTFD